MRHEIFEPADVHKHFGTTLWSVEIDSCQNEPTASREKLRETLDRTGPFEPKSATLYLNVSVIPTRRGLSTKGGQIREQFGLRWGSPRSGVSPSCNVNDQNVRRESTGKRSRTCPPSELKSELKANSGKSIRNFLNIAITGL